MKWLDVVKKHAKMNPGKSLKEYLADAQKEYASLKKQGKIDPPKNASAKKGSKKNKKSKKQRGGEDPETEDTEEGFGGEEINADEEEGIVENVPNHVEETPNHVVEGGKKKRRSKKGGEFVPKESNTSLGSAPVGGSKRRRSKKGGEFVPKESNTSLGSAPVGGGKRRRNRTRKGGKSRSVRRTARRSRSRSSSRSRK